MSDNRLDDLLFEEDDGPDDDVPEQVSSSLSALATAATTVASQPPPTSTTSTTTGSGSNPVVVVERLFALLKQHLSPEVYEKIKLRVQMTTDEKQMLLIVRQMAGEEAFKKVMGEFRSDSATPPVSVVSSTAIPMPQMPGSAPIPMPTSELPPAAAKPLAPTPSPPPTAVFEALLRHAASCTEVAGMCPQARCGDIRKMIQHTSSCPNRAQCPTCLKVAKLVQYHATICPLPLTNKCPVIFCDQLRRKVAAAAAAAAPSSSTPSKAPVTEVKTEPGANKFEMYGECLQLLLHAQQCGLTACPVGARCSQTKTLLSQMNLPNPSARAKTFKQVYDHFQTCKKKDTCLVCTRGMQPLLPASGVKRPTPMSSTQPPSKKPKTVGRSTPTPASIQSVELASVGATDIRKEGDVLTHTVVDLTEERRRLLLGVKPTLDPKYRRELSELNSKKENWSKNNLFDSKTLARRIQEITKRHGVSAANDVTEYMSRALQDYLRQVMEDLVVCSQHRCNMEVTIVAQAGRSMLKIAREASRTAALHTAYDKDFAEIQQTDRELRQTLIIEAEQEEMAERERQKKRKKAGTPMIETVDDVNADIIDLATKDLKKRLSADRKQGKIEPLGGVNSSVPQPHQDVTIRNRITMADASYYLTHTMSSARSKLYCRADAAAILTKSL